MNYHRSCWLPRDRESRDEIASVRRTICWDSCRWFCARRRKSIWHSGPGGNTMGAANGTSLVQPCPRNLNNLVKKNSKKTAKIEQFSHEKNPNLDRFWHDNLNLEFFPLWKLDNFDLINKIIKILTNFDIQLLKFWLKKTKFGRFSLLNLDNFDLINKKSRFWPILTSNYQNFDKFWLLKPKFGQFPL